MKNALISLGLLCLFTVSLALPDCNNPLLETFGLDEDALNAAESGEDLPYCKSLKAGDTCCDEDLVKTFQKKAQDLADSLTKEVIKRDTGIVDIRDNVVPGLQSAMARLQNVFANLGANAAAVTGVLGDMDELTGEFDEISTQILASLPTLKADFASFQTSRTTCVLSVIELQAAAWCLACDPNYADYGVAAETAVPISADVQKRIMNACYDYVVGSAAQSALLSISSSATMLDSLVTVLEKLMAGDATAIQDLQKLFGGAIGGGEAEEPSVALAPSQVPEDCKSKDDCAWILESFLPGLQLSEDNLLLGGEPGKEARLLTQFKRNLAGEEWDPSDDESGTKVDFKDDPAGVKDAGTAASAGIAKVGVAIVGLLAVFLF